MDSQHIRGSETLLKSSPQCFCRIFWSLSKKFSSKNSVLAVSKILRLFVYLLTPDDKLSLSVKASASLNQFKRKYLQIEKYLLSFFLHFLNLYESWTLWKERWTSEEISFWNFRLQKARLPKCLKRPVSGHLWRVNMLKGPKHWSTFHSRYFVRFF